MHYTHKLDNKSTSNFAIMYTISVHLGESYVTARLMTLQEFLLSEMKRLDVSARELARRAGLGESTVQKLIDERDPRSPTIETLEKLAKVTGQTMLTLVRLVKPDADDVDADALIMARRIQALPEATRKVLEDLTRSATLGQDDQAKK
jgi:transcriptional regulator with XRE-family HTH domain